MSASTMPPIPARSVAPVKAPSHDPSCVVQRAWSVLRLAPLQELIRVTIAELQTLPRPVPIDPGPEGASPVAGPSSLTPTHQRDPVVEALRACCDELRDASGMSGAHDDRVEHCQAVRDYMQQHSPTWAATFTRALAEYRRTAAVALEASFARTAAA